MPKPSNAIDTSNVNQLLTAFNRYLQYGEVPSNITADKLYEVTMKMLLNIASGSFYGYFIRTLKDKVSPLDIVIDVVEKAKSTLSGKSYINPINFNYIQNISWAWSNKYRVYKPKISAQEYKKEVSDWSWNIDNDTFKPKGSKRVYRRNPVAEQEYKEEYGNGIHQDYSLSTRPDEPMNTANRDQCLEQMNAFDSTGLTAISLKHNDGLSNTDIESKLGLNAIEVAYHYYNARCFLSYCLDINTKRNRCLLALAGMPKDCARCFEVESLYAMGYSPQTIQKEMKMSQAGISKWRVKARSWINNCIQE